MKGQLMDLSEPKVMGILNVTPDSFFAGSRKQTEYDIAQRANEIIEQGGAMMRMALAVVRHEQPNVPLSVDTFRADVARMVVEEFGADIINDVGEGADPDMFRMVARLQVPYILMSVQKDLHDTLMVFAQKVQQLRDLGQKDIILDPGFGFGKTLDDNYRLMNEMEKLQVLQLPLLVGISRKSMIYKLLGITQDEALNGTTFLNTIALMKGADILRVHDVKEAVEIVKMYDRLRS